MHERFKAASEKTFGIISAAIEVHNQMGPGLLESIYEWCLTKELEIRGHYVRNQKAVCIYYKGFEREDELRFDLLVDECVLIEVKAVDVVHPVHKAQLLSYMKLLDVPVGLLINFNVTKLTTGVSRLVLRDANKDS